MSHVVKNVNEKGKILSIAALSHACSVLEVGGQSGLLELVQTEKGKGKYRTWKSDHGRLVGDWDTPEGMSSAEVGENADYIIRVTKEGKEFLRKKGYSDPYEVGVVWEEKEQCYRLVYDFFAKAKGLEFIIGETKVDYRGPRSGQLTQSCPELIKWYNACRDKLMAEQNGDTQVIVPQKDGSLCVGGPDEFLSLPDGSKIPLGVGDVVAEIHVGARVGTNLGGVQ